MNFKKSSVIYFYCMTLLAGLSISACSDEDMDPYLETSISKISLNSNGLTESENNANFEVGTNGDWEVTSHDEWITLNHEEGERGRTTLFLTVSENLTGADREGSIVIEGSGITRTVIVTQTLKTETLFISPLTITLNKSGLLSTGENATLDLSTNSPWSISEIPDWIKADKSSGRTGSATITLTAEQNKTTSDRTGEIKIISGSQEKIVTVIQNLEGLIITPTEIRVNKTGTTDGVIATFDVTATGNWTLSTSSSWIHASKASGNAGKETVTLTFDENTTLGERKGVISVTTPDGLEGQVSITQTAKSSAYEDDGKAAGFVYLNQTFDWCRDFGGQDQVADKTQSTTISIYSNDAAKTAFDNSGIQDLNVAAKCIYLAQHYLKMGKGNYQTGIIIPQIPQLAAGKTSDINLSFDVAPNIGSGGPDATTITVEITEGSGGVNNADAKTSQPISIGITTDGQWAHKSVTLYGVTTSTKVAIRSTQQGVTGYYRWFLDNVKMEKTNQ